jgi:type I restriction enzyme M protein
VSRISQSQLESYLWGAAEHLRGSIDAGDYKQFIFPLLFFKRLCDVYDEETAQALRASGGDAEFAAFAENHRFQVPDEAHWKEIRKETRNVGNAIQRAMRSIESANKNKLFGIFGDAQWTNKDRLSDETMRELVEHFSSLELTITNLPEDELGNGYEFLIKKFADDSGHTAAEFYTNRTVVHLMTEMLDVQPGESVYDPTCGSGGMLMSCVAHLRKQGKEWRNVRLFGQERNLMTSSIARMNCFLHGIEDFRIERGDTLAEPKLVEGDKLMQFDVVLANPPYSIKQWDREAFRSDPWGRNLFGVPPQGRADYAFQQHINKSLKAKTGRCAVLWPHGVLFRQEEEEIRSKLIEADLIECVIGLGPNLFYNSPMEACILVCRTQKSKTRKGKVLFINAVNEVTRERAQSFLTEEHQSRILQAYQSDADIPGLSRHVSINEIRSKKGSLSIPLYLGTTEAENDHPTFIKLMANGLLEGYLEASDKFRAELDKILPNLARRYIEQSNGPEHSLCELITSRQGWSRVRFGNIVENYNQTGKGLGAAPSRYIGLEHIEPGTLVVKSYGDTSAGTTFTRTCKPGQVLFGKRRAYQRKVAVASFEALVSGDIYVLEPKSPNLAPGLLPFICMSDRFFEHAVGTSAGSLSPRTNWSSLANYEFDLPPLEQQLRIVAVMQSLISAQSGVQKTRATLTRNTEVQIISKIREGLFSKPTKTSRNFGTIPHDWTECKLGDICTQITDGEHATPPRTKTGVYLLSARNIQNGRLQLEDVDYVSLETYKSLSKRIAPKAGDVLISCSGSIGRVCRIPEGNDFALVRSVAILKPNYHFVNSTFLEKCLQTPFLQNQIRASISQLAQGNLFQGAIRQLVIPMPPLAEQEMIVSFIDNLAIPERHLLECQSRLKSLETKLLSIL